MCYCLFGSIKAFDNVKYILHNGESFQRIRFEKKFVDYFIICIIFQLSKSLNHNNFKKCRLELIIIILGNINKTLCKLYLPEP